jgi:transposase
MVFDHAPEYLSQWAAIRSVGEKLGIRTESLRRWVCQTERDAGQRPALTTSERGELKRPRRENVELKRANEILRKAFSPRRSSTAERSAGRLRRSAPCDVWGRADLTPHLNPEHLHEIATILP